MTEVVYIMKENHHSSILKDWILPLAIAVVIAIVVNKTLFFMVEVPTTSMYPTIQKGDRLLVTKVYNPGNLKRGDIVVFNSKELNMTLVKRLIGLPGDKIEIKSDGTMYLNGTRYDEPYVKQPGAKPANFDVPKDCFVFLGDNRRDSLDARYWDNPYIPASEIMGKAQLTLFPFNRVTVLK
jgi:signal peptidase I